MTRFGNVSAPQQSNGNHMSIGFGTRAVESAWRQIRGPQQHHSQHLPQQPQQLSHRHSYDTIYQQQNQQQLGGALYETSSSWKKGPDFKVETENVCGQGRTFYPGFHPENKNNKLVKGSTDGHEGGGGKDARRGGRGDTQKDGQYKKSVRGDSLCRRARSGTRARTNCLENNTENETRRSLDLNLGETDGLDVNHKRLPNRINFVEDVQGGGGDNYLGMKTRNDILFTNLHPRRCLSPALTWSRLRSCADEIVVDKIRARVDRRPVVVDEKTPSVVIFKSPPFKAAARISLPALKRGEAWTVGWIQACSKMKFRITYGTEGFSSWEFPQLKTQSMISDSDGRNFPWYGGNKEISNVIGPCGQTTVEVRMTDSFAPRVTWLPPFYPQPMQERGTECRLTRIHRDQSFFTWLVARNETTQEMLVLATIKWRAFIDVAFDPKAPLGQRGTVIGDEFPQFQPELLPTNEPIPLCALSPPHANEAQVLVWRRHGGQSEVLIPSVFPPP